ncbi:uncharacterized protein N7459_000819 [Penicillium hispanicum]|uniref:uncharacterized protein n=1 Tax=Penicillium hispanicum TaxID=1080232 RepID=UPI002541A7BB|nr:uncharacterized protein N7459_000819 [Penicillium hispanicum]KAJ5594611.1 hypothetical protein N7459_000819 [Penicillium hispanicum]
MRKGTQRMPGARAAGLAVAKKAARSPPAGNPMVLPSISWSCSVQEQALTHIFKYYVGTNTSRGIISYVSNSLNMGSSEALQSIITAIAAEEYGKALRATNKDLQDAVLAKSDSTLTTVIMLALYEIISCHESDVVNGWLNHVRGSVKLLELRGPQQLESPIGLELFTLVRFQMAMSNLFFRTNAYTSPTLLSLSKLARTHCDGDLQAVEDFYDILLSLNELSIMVKKAYKTHGFHGDTAPLLGEALRLDAELALWEVSLGPAWQYTIAHNAPSFSNGSTPFPSHNIEYYVYPSLDIAMYWNHYRQARIVLLAMVRAMCSRMSEAQEMPELQQVQLESIAVHRRLVNDVCASVPYYFIAEEAYFGGVARLPWPLFVAAECADPDEYTRNWITQILGIIGTSAGMQQAYLLSGLLQQGDHSWHLIPGKV